MSDETPNVAVACQGGGSHTAFTAGVLQRLLDGTDPDGEIVGFSGTSGGAICALLAWYGRVHPDRSPDALRVEGVCRSVGHTVGRTCSNPRIAERLVSRMLSFCNANECERKYVRQYRRQYAIGCRVVPVEVLVVVLRTAAVRMGVTPRLARRLQTYRDPRCPR